MARLGIDLSGDSIALADVRQAGECLQLRGYALFDPIPDRTALMEALRRARDAQAFPLTAEVIAWAGEPRVSAVRAAGYGIERVILPGEALARVARLHGGFDTSSTGEVVALASLDPTSGSMAVVRDGGVLYEAPLTWSSSATPGSPNPKGAELLRHYAFLFELTELLHGAFALVRQSHNTRISKILTCGSLPDLRSVTMTLAQEFDVDVETLDSAEPFDLRRLKGHTREEAEGCIAALQLAIVASRRWHRTSQSPVKQILKILKIALPVGVAVAAYGLYAGGSLSSFGSFGSSGPSGSSGSSSGSLRSSGSSTSSGSPTAASPGGPGGSVTGGLPAVPPPSSRDLRPPGPTQSEATSGASSAAATERDAENLRNQENLRNLRNQRNLTNDPTPVSLSLSSILYSRERRLAIIEGQVLGVGDTVAGMKIVEIQPNGVILRDRAGRLRRAELRIPRPTGREQERDPD